MLRTGRPQAIEPQVILLHGGSKNFFIRADFCLAQADSVGVNSGTDPFFCDIPHDHNFSFLTVGYLGSVYWRDNTNMEMMRWSAMPARRLT